MSVDRPRLAIVVPVYNDAPTRSDCLARPAAETPGGRLPQYSAPAAATSGQLVDTDVAVAAGAVRRVAQTFADAGDHARPGPERA